MANMIPCFLCTQKLEIRKDKHAKPYIVCQNCLMQSFIRGKEGIERLAELVETIRQHDFPFKEHAAVLFQIQGLLSEIRGLKKEIEGLESVFEVFSKDEYRERARKLLHRRIETLLERLERIADGDEAR